MNLKQLIEEVTADWFYQHPHGYANIPYNTQDLKVLSEVLQSKKYPTQLIEDVIESLTEIDFKDQAAFDKYQSNHKMRDTTKVTIGGKEMTAGQAQQSDDEESEDDTSEKPTVATKSSVGVHGNLEDGDNQDKHDVLEHGFDGVKDYYEKNGIKAEDGKGFKKPAPGSAGSAFNEIVSGEGIHILSNNPKMTEAELAEKMFNEYGQSALGQEQNYSSQVKDDIPPRLQQNLIDAKGNGTIEKPEDPEAYAKAKQQISTYSKCIIVAKAAKDKHDTTARRVSNLQNPKDKDGNPLPPKFGKAKEPQTYYGTAKSLKAQQTAVENANRVIMPDGTSLRKEDVQELIRQSGGGLNPSDTATFIEDDKGTLMIQFHSDKTDPSDPQGSKTLSTDMEDIKNRIDGLELTDSFTPEKKAAAQTVVKGFNKSMSDIETTYDDQTAKISENLESMDINNQVEVMQELTAKSKTNKNYLNLAMFDSKGKGELKGKYLKHLPQGSDPANLTDAEKIQAIRSFIKTPTPEDAKRADKKNGDDLKVISKIAEHLSIKMGKDAPDEINIKKVLAKRRQEVVDLHRKRKEELDKVDPGPPALGDAQEAEEVMEGFHLSILDDEPYDEDEKDQSKRLKSIMSGTFDVHMGGTVANRDTLRAALGVNSLQEFKDNFRVKDEERYTYGKGGEEGGIITGKVVFTYVVNKEGGDPIKLGEKTYRSSDGPTGTTRTIIKYAEEFQQQLKDAQ